MIFFILLFRAFVITCSASPQQIFGGENRRTFFAETQCWALLSRSCGLENPQRVANLLSPALCFFKFHHFSAFPASFLLFFRLLLLTLAFLFSFQILIVFPFLFALPILLTLPFLSSVPILLTLPLLSSVPILLALPLLSTLPIVLALPFLSTLPILLAFPFPSTLPILLTLPFLSTLPILLALPFLSSFPILLAFPFLSTLPTVLALPISPIVVPISWSVLPTAWGPFGPRPGVPSFFSFVSARLSAEPGKLRICQQILNNHIESWSMWWATLGTRKTSYQQKYRHVHTIDH